MTHLQRAVELLRAEPYQTAWELARALGIKPATLSSILYKATLVPEHGVMRRESSVAHRGYEYWI